MKLINSKPILHFDEFIKNLKKTDTILIYHDRDPDGICSAVICAKAIEKIIGKKVEHHLGRKKSEYTLTTDILDHILSLNVTKVIALDVGAFDENTENLLTLTKHADILIIDHHKLYADFNRLTPPAIVIIKPQMTHQGIEPQQYCTTKLVYDLMRRHSNLDDLDWMAVIGMIADVATQPWKPFVTHTFKKYALSIKKDLFTTKLGMAAQIISSSEVYNDKNITLAFDILYAARTYRDILSSRLLTFHTILQKEINYWITSISSRAEFYNNQSLILYFVQPKHPIASIISTILAFKYPHKTLLILNADVTDKNMIHVSARRNDRKIAVNDLLEHAILGFENARAGGHVPAAGAGFPRKYLDAFKQRIIQSLTKTHRKV